MKKSAIFLLLFISIFFNPIPITPGVAQAQSDIDTALARGTVQAFLRVLSRPELAQLANFYLAEDADAAQIISNLQPVATFSIRQSGWLVPAKIFQAEAVIQPENRHAVIQVAKYNSRWRVKQVEVSAAESTLATTAALHPATGNGSGQLVFQTESGGDIYLINADGTNLRRVTHGIDPQLSPDGSQIAFTRWNPHYKLYTINVDGTGETVRVDGRTMIKSPTWSADGSHIIFSYRTFFDPGKRVKFNLYELTAPPVIPANVRDLRFSADGTVEYTIPPDSHWGISQVNLSTGQIQDFDIGSPYGYAPIAHPTDSDRLIYRSDKGLVAFDIRLQSGTPISFDNRDRGAISISPDGTAIAFSFWQDGHWEIYTIGVDGNHRRRLTETPLSVIAQKNRSEMVRNAEGYLTLRPVQTNATGSNWNNIAPAWSPDGSQIAFMTDRSGSWEIWVMNADGSNQRPMFSNGATAGLKFKVTGNDERMLSWR